MRHAIVFALLASTSLARADEVEDLVAKGEELAKAGELSQAIASFKAADAKQPRAKHACLIGLAYTRRELWPQAELFFALCRTRATAADPLPDWIDDAEATLAAKLVAIHAAPITIVVEPADAHPILTVSSFEPDEVFAPRTIHLGRGMHVIEASAPGYVTARQEVAIASEQPQTVTITLHPPEVPKPPPPPVVVPSRVPWIVGGGGVAIGLVGAAVQLFVYKPARDKLASAGNVFAYADDLPPFRRDRDITIALYAGALAVVAAAITLHYTVYHVAVAADAHGAMATLEWHR